MERTQNERPPWLDRAGVGRSEGEPTRADAVEVARLAAALERIEQDVGVVLGSTWEERTRFSTDDGDHTEIREELRAEAGAFVRWTPVSDYAERTHDACAKDTSWRAWATVSLDPATLREGLRGWLAARGPAGADLELRGTTATVRARVDAFVHVVVEAPDGGERVAYAGPIAAGGAATVELGPVAAVRVFVVPAASGARELPLDRLYTCVSAPPKQRCTLIHRTFDP